MKILIGLLILVSSLVAVLEAVTVNAPAPDFSLTNSQDKQRTLNDYKGKVLFINFWASWCAPCQVELPELNQLAIDEAGKNVAVIAINVDKEQFKAGTLLTKLGLQSPDVEILWDPESKAVATYDVETMPTSFILDNKGDIRFLHSGFQNHDPDKWRKEIENLLKGS
jgi:thiol-disulfide isomerase/thioredoxin